MNTKILKIMAENKENFVPYIISEKQMAVIQKVLARSRLTRTEYNYLYNGIKKKMKALDLLAERETSLYFYNIPEDILPERKQKAAEILSELKAKGTDAFISGSFLFSAAYNDIDIFMISNKHKEEHKENFHYINIKQKDLEKPVFYSAAKSCISNFDIMLPAAKIKKLHFEQALNSYQEAVINILENEDIKHLKGLIADYSAYNLKKILNSSELNAEFRKFTEREDKIKLISELIKELILDNFNKNYILIKLGRYVKMLEGDIKNTKLNDHLKIYKKTYGEIIDECRRAKK